MNLIQLSIRQPVTVAVGVLLILLSGVIALKRIPVQLTPNVEDTIVSVQTTWEGASPEEVEQEIVDEQEDKLQGIANLREMTSNSLQGVGRVRLEFQVGTAKEEALREVSDKLREVPSYPENADEPVIEASDPQNRDYIAWIVFSTTDPELDIRNLQDFAEDRIKPVLERVAGVSEVNVLGGREREVQVRFDPLLLAQRGITVPQLVAAIRGTNRNVSGGAVSEDKSDVRLRLVSQYETVEEVESTVVASTDGGPIHVHDVAAVVEDYKEAATFVHSRGKPVIAINAQKEVGANVMEVMTGLQAAVARLNEPGGVLEAQARSMGLNGTLALEQVYDQTVYIDDALLLVEDNIWLGGGLAVLVLLLFLRSIRSAGIVALAIPISVVGAVATMVAMGRTVNVISLAGMAFAVGMVVDNAIVVLENVFRHLEMGKPPARAALDGGKEVYGAVVASTLTTVVVFVPILLIQDEAGQLFRDISLAIVAAVSLSLLVSLTVIPSAASRLMKEAPSQEDTHRRGIGPLLVRVFVAPFGWIAPGLGRFTRWISGSVLARVAVIVVLTTLSALGTWYLAPPSDYLPQGNRNLVFGLLIPPPGYSLEQRQELAHRIEDTVRPFFEVGRLPVGSPEYEAAKAKLPAVPTFDMRKMAPGEPVVPPPLENYFIVSFDGGMFHGGIASESEHVVDLMALFRHATRGEVAPGVLAFAFQVPLFRLGGSTGSAVKVNFAGDDLDQVSRSALAVYGEMIQRYGVFSIQPDPNNFNIPGPELQVRPDLVRLGEVGMSPSELGTAVQALGDGAIVGEYRIGGQTVDLKVLAAEKAGAGFLGGLGDAPIATPSGAVVPLSSLADLQRVNAAPQINREGRQRAVTLQFTPPQGMPLEQAVTEVDQILQDYRERGAIPPTVGTSYTGSASKLAAVQDALLGDGTLAGTLGSAMLLALLVVYLLMCVLFQSFLTPLIILFSVPLATVGGFAALRAVHAWSVSDPYMPVQNLDVLTMLGFVILIGVVVNNAILIVHQTGNFMRGEEDQPPLSWRDAIAEAVRSRVRPIFMSTLTSLGGMAPLVFMPGSGSELYRGLGSVVLGGLLVSTVFTLFLVPSLLSLATQASEWLRARRAARTDRPASGSGASAARVAGRVGSLLLSLAAVPWTGGCAVGGRSGDAEHLAAEAARRRTEALGPADAPAVAPVAEVPRSLAVLGERLAELEELGGPQSYRKEDVALPAELAPGAARPVPVDLARAVRAAAANNLGVRFARLQPEIDAEDVLVARAEFDSVLFSDAQLERSDQPRVVPVLGGIVLGSPDSQSSRQSLEAGVRRRFESGATVTASAFLERSDDQTDGIDFTPDPALRSALGLSVTQPLLRGAGSVVNAAGIELAETVRQRSELEVRAQLLELIASTELAYWDLVQAWRFLEIRERLLAQGEEVRRVLDERRSFDAAPAQAADALATVERRRTELVRAQRSVTAASDRLEFLMNDPELALAGDGVLRPDVAWDESAPSFRLREAVERALEGRPEPEQALLAIRDAELRERVAADARRARLDLTASLSLVGLDDGVGSSLEDVAQADFPNAFLGLSFELPSGNRAARAEERRARLETRQALLAHDGVVQSIVQEVKDALRDVQTTFDLIAAARSARLAQTESLRALLLEEERRSQLTPEFLALKFQRQEALALAQAREVEAQADYHRARSLLHRAQGLGLGGERLELEPAGK